MGKIDPYELEIFPLVKGADQYSKVSYPLRYGHLGEIRSREYIYQFNLNGEIKFITGRNKEWPDPSEWLKRTVTNDWLYYSTGGYSGTMEYSGEYYIPCAQYFNNSILLNSPFDYPAVRSAIESYDKLYESISGLNTDYLDPETRNFVQKIRTRPSDNLKKRSSELREILGDRITVLPPDTRHVDYNVIPVVIADGCLYKCGFCAVKSPRPFSRRSVRNIKDQINALKKFYGDDIVNYNSLFLGQHDALNAGIDLIEEAALYAYDEFGFADSNMKGANLFLFGSVYSVLNAGDDLFKRLNSLPCNTYINIGLESADGETLLGIKKNITVSDVEKTFSRMTHLNREYANLELTSNFLFSSGFPENHYPSIFRLIEKEIKHREIKGTIYFSPLQGSSKNETRETKRKFYDIKRRLLLPSYLYLIQRL